MLVTFILAICGDVDDMFSTAQLLWVNMIMDPLAALALATDSPSPTVLDRKPEGKGAPLVSKSGWVMIAAQACYQLAVILLLRSRGGAIFVDAGQHVMDQTTATRVLVFNTFVLMQFFNLYK